MPPERKGVDVMSIRRTMRAVLLTFALLILFSVCVEAKTKADYTLYADFLKQDEFTYKLKKKTDNGLSTYGLTFYDRYGSGRYEKKTISFCLLDINGDGVKELIVARNAPNWDPPAITFYVFTIRGGKVRFVKNLGTNDYTVRMNGKKILYSSKYKALYCPCTIDTSDAYTMKTQMSYSLFRMRGTKLVRYCYAERDVEQEIEEGSERKITFRYQEAGESAVETASGTKPEAYASLMKAYFRSTDLTAVSMVRNSAKNRKKILGKA